MKERNAELLEILRREVVVATGCTEPIAVAYNVAYAKERAQGELLHIEVKVDPGVYKNAKHVGIPGIKERGLSIAAALGAVIGKTDQKLEIILAVSDEILEKANQLVAEGKVSISMDKTKDKLYVETTLTTTCGTYRAFTKERHLNVSASGEGADINCFEKPLQEATKADIKKYLLSDFIDFSEGISLQDISFLQEGIDLNYALSREGREIEHGIAKCMQTLHQRKLIACDLLSETQCMVASASEARMSGSRRSAMSSAGSGNHGITIFMTNYAVAKHIQSDEEKLLRSLALSNLITVYIKAYTGTLSAMCGCGVAAGIGASAGVVYLLGGKEKEIFGAVKNMIGSISGMICDGGKEGCAYKLALTAGWAVQAALFAITGGIINERDGILSESFEEAVKNMGYVCNPGMVKTNEAILTVMEGLRE